jgi:hypothetical protein
MHGLLTSLGQRSMAYVTHRHIYNNFERHKHDFCSACYEHVRSAVPEFTRHIATITHRLSE